MKKLDENVSRRDFGKLAVAAFGGVVAGSMLGSSLLSADDAKKPAAAKADAHACCGLNACKGEGKGGDNACAGQGGCATAEAHSCAGSNACKGQGGTGDNACKGKGSCAVPIKGEGWKKARTHYEASMKKSGKKYGDAPASCSK
jgi:hypothetical protein